MKVELTESVVETNSNAKVIEFTPTQTGILHMIDVVARRQYQNPIKSVMIEYVQNALDSHDENGNPERPIEITIPSEDYLFFEVRDYGISMSNREISSIISKIGLSTKDQTDELRGGFGLGKLVFCAYNTKTMQISNFYGGYRNDWSAHLSGGKGGIQPMGKVKSNEDQGLLIKIPVKLQDVEMFRKYSFTLYSYLKTLPIIKNYSEHNFNKSTIVESVQYDWEIVEQSGNMGIAVMGELAYPLDWNHVRNISGEISNALTYGNQNLVLHFNIGELDITSSRDSLDYGSEKTNQKIIEKVQRIIEHFQNKYSNFSTLSDFDKKQLIRSVRDQKNSDNLIGKLNKSFLNIKEVDDFYQLYPINITSVIGKYSLDKDNNTTTENSINYNRGSYSYVSRGVNRGDYRFSLNTDNYYNNTFSLYHNKYFTFVSKRISSRRVNQIMNNTSIRDDAYNGNGERLYFIIGKTQEDIDNFVRDNLIDPSILISLDSYESELKKSGSSVGLNSPIKVYESDYIYSSNGYAKRRYHFNQIDTSDIGEYDTEKTIYVRFDRFSTDETHEARSLIRTAINLEIITKDELPTVLAFNSLSEKKFKPEISFKHFNDYAEELMKKIEDKLNSRISEVYDCAVRRAYRNLVGWKLESILSGIENEISDNDLKYIFNTQKQKDTDYTELTSHPRYSEFLEMATNYVQLVLTKLGMDDYDEFMQKCIKVYLNQ